MEVIGNLIGTVGFPCACVVGLAFFIYKVYFQNLEDSRKREAKYNQQLTSFSEALNDHTKALNDINQTLNIMSERMDDLETELKTKRAKASSK